MVSVIKQLFGLLLEQLIKTRTTADYLRLQVTEVSLALQSPRETINSRHRLFLLEIRQLFTRLQLKKAIIDNLRCSYNFSCFDQFL